MHRLILVLAICLIPVAGTSYAAAFLEAGVSTVLLGEDPSTDQLFDGVSVRIGHTKEIREGLGFGASLDWRWYPYEEPWNPFSPDSDGYSHVRAGTCGENDGAHHLEFGFFVRLSGTTGRLRPFLEMETGCAALVLRDDTDGDLFASARAGGELWLGTGLVLCGSIGNRVYFLKNYSMLPAALELRVLF